MASSRGLRLRRFADRLAVDHEPGLTTTQLLLTNHDLKPVEPERRQWKSWNFVGFWIADSFNINTWMISSSMVSAGLSWWQSWLCVWIGYAIAGAFVCATGRIGATYHIGFPVVARSSLSVFLLATFSLLLEYRIHADLIHLCSGIVSSYTINTICLGSRNEFHTDLVFLAVG